VDRALEKLHLFLKHRGVTLSAAALGTALTTEAVTAAPVGLAGSIAGTVLASTAAGGGITVTLVKLMTMTKLKFGIISVIAVTGVATELVIQSQSQASLREENQALHQQASQLSQVAAENERLSNLVVQANSAESLSREQMRELLRLRGEVGQLRQESNLLETLRMQNQQLRTQQAGVSAQTLAPDTLKVEPGALYIRMFLIEKPQNLKQAKGLDPEKPLQDLVLDYLKQNGVELQPPSYALFDTNRQALTVRATFADLDKVEVLVGKLREKP
jgi:myosin heavy subunit